MPRVSYFSPFIPPEWIAAHGFAPEWLVTSPSEGSPSDAAWRGVCPQAAAVIAQAERTSTALVLSTACDQMRYASAYLDADGKRPVFLFNVPSTWQSPGVRGLYLEELRRLSRFLVRLGGQEPTTGELGETILRFDDRRRDVLAGLPRLAARCRRETLAGLRSDLSTKIALEQSRDRSDGVPLLLLGGPSLEQKGSFLTMVENSGGKVVVDGTETGERTLPGPVDRGRLRDDPVGELVRIYFDTIPDVFRRPNTQLYDWLARQFATQTVRGVIVRRYPFCDLWHAEVQRLRQWSRAPVLDLDVGTGEGGESSRIQGRIEAFLEMLR